MCIENVYFHGPLYKKLKNSGVTNSVMDLSTGFISINNLYTDSKKHKVFWSSKIENEKTSINEISDIKNMKNTIAKKMSYMNFNAFKTDNIMDDTTSRKIRTRTYILKQLPKAPFFNNLSKNKSILMLLAPKFVGFKKLLLNVL
ncbi:hypothetical protein G9A89_005769 [Geosiphon pyriformis]|nr:hypothetical protein G9A89_000098 [Geosiphon pyriformis]KAG9303859.1 hypothetical protein G9A89_005769 [Geosiphon pyriformis]